MFCYQCEQTAKGQGCTIKGVCGKDEKTASLQDLIVDGLKELSFYAYRLKKLGVNTSEADKMVIEGLFTTVTNVDFDPERLRNIILELTELRKAVKTKYIEVAQEKGIIPEKPEIPALDIFSDDIDILFKQAEAISILKRKESENADILSLQEIITYGLKGAAAYADHARALGHESDEVYEFFHEALSFLTKKAPTLDEALGYTLKTGEVNLKVMELLDAANTGAYGHPEPTKVRVTPVKGKSIVVSGHDLKDLEELLKQTEGKGINVYTHGEMLPCLAYPELKKYKHLVGNYGGAWQDQQKEFAEFPGAILMTTNCIQDPKHYTGRIFTTGLVAWPNVVHVADKNFQPVIDAALEAEGFTEDAEEKYITIGFGRNAVLGVADKVIDAVKAGQIKHFFLIGGCDGAKSGRNYYTEFAQKVPQDSVILTLACGKYRFNKLEFGDIGGIPRLLDIGQCNDAYSAVKIAVALAEAFDTDVNSLPLSFILSWYEQKAVAILLTLFYLGIKNIRLGPTLPAFVTPNVLNVLVEKFNIQPITTPDEDLKAILG
ncbi:MAG: hydroxylamine reductase [Candidatus Melainabacteria bacterium GWA2_34_9]|nr:MAG: hydroxylamine reductase [Candidatus Melainabacteria bacterium GWA2_34_9]